MTPATILTEARAVGVTLWADGDALGYRGPREVLAKLLPALKTHKPDILAALAHPDLPGVSPELAARLSAEAEDLREHFEERAGILEYDAGLPRPEAELEAARITATLARNRGYLWASLRSALASYSVLLAQVLKAAPGRAVSVVRQGDFTGAHEVKP